VSALPHYLPADDLDTASARVQDAAWRLYHAALAREQVVTEHERAILEHEEALVAWGRTRDQAVGRGVVAVVPAEVPAPAPVGPQGASAPTSLRGMCPICGRMILVRRSDGKLRPHRPPAGRPLAGLYCPGTDMAPSGRGA
jgi:hypothetical protein